MSKKKTEPTKEQLTIQPLTKEQVMKDLAYTKGEATADLIFKTIFEWGRQAGYKEGMNLAIKIYKQEPSRFDFFISFMEEFRKTWNAPSALRKAFAFVEVTDEEPLDRIKQILKNAKSYNKVAEAIAPLIKDKLKKEI
jgi:hypothetical protein